MGLNSFGSKTHWPSADLGGHEADALVENVLVVVGPLQEILVIVLLAERLGPLGHAPVVVSGFQRNRHRLAPLERIDLFDRLLLALLQRREEPLLQIHAVQRGLRHVPPRQKGVFHLHLLECFVSLGHVEIAVAFHVGVQGHRDDVMAAEPAVDGLHPARSFVESHEGTHEVDLFLGVQEQVQRLQGAVIAPHGGAGADRIKAVAVGLVYLLVDGAVVFAVLHGVGHTGQHAVEGRVEDGALLLAPPFTSILPSASFQVLRACDRADRSPTPEFRAPDSDAPDPG